MKEFVERLKTDKEFAAEFKEFLTGKNAKVKEGTRLVGQQLDKLVMGSIKEFAASKGIILADDEQTAKSLAGLTRQICLQMDDMIVKSFAALEGSMKQPVDVPPEMIKAVRENKELYLECLHKADEACEAAIQKCLREMDAAVRAVHEEFAEKAGHQLPELRTGLNKAIAQKLNEVVHTQLKGLMELSKTAAE